MKVISGIASWYSKLQNTVAISTALGTLTWFGITDKYLGW